MLFNSFVFIICFLPVVFAGYTLLNRRHLPVAAKGWLVFSSLFFYGWWNVKYVPLILVSIGANYFIAQTMQSKVGKTRKAWFVCGLVFNVALLCYFKYVDFFLANLNALTGAGFDLLHIALPLGISFFTLQQLAFQIDAYENIVESHGLLDYFLFVSFFPQLVAGPIVHHKQMMPQFESLRSKVFSYDNVCAGLFVFSIGLFKKTVVADTFSLAVRQGFDHLPSLSLMEAWLASLSYSFQIYFDFSGYSDMAIGLALLFNINIPVNFDSPFKSASLIEFWNRWHITLSNFINAYLYTPFVRLFGFSFSKSLLAILLSMFIAGFWHGASWIFVFWGVLHGVGICVNHLWKNLRRPIPGWLAWFITFNFVNVTLVFFRSRNFADAFKVLGGMVGLDGLLPKGISATYLLTPQVLFRLKELPIFTGMTFSDFLINSALVLGSVYVVFFAKNAGELRREFKPTAKHLGWTVACLALSFLFMNSFAEKEFLYFEF